MLGFISNVPVVTLIVGVLQCDAERRNKMFVQAVVRD